MTRSLLALLLAGCASGDPLGEGQRLPPGEGCRLPGEAQLCEGCCPADLEVVRFIVVGDTGEGNEAQHAVAAAMADKCAADGCDFILLAGDNIYDRGVEGPDDPQWETKFEAPYAALELPFFAVLGNHDFGKNALDYTRPPHQVAYTERSEKWVMPWTHYSFAWGPVGFLMLDTNSLMQRERDFGDQEAWLPAAHAQLGTRWVFAVGHHPYKSNGSHGNAGHYDGIEAWVPLGMALRGEWLRRFFEDTLCGTVDAYFAGHDHDRQWLDTRLCGAELVVSGAGSKTRALARRDANPTLFEDDATEGFFWARIEGDTFTGQFIDREGHVDFEHVVTRAP